MLDALRRRSSISENGASPIVIFTGYSLTSFRARKGLSEDVFVFVSVFVAAQRPYGMAS